MKQLSILCFCAVLLCTACTQNTPIEETNTVSEESTNMENATDGEQSMETETAETEAAVLSDTITEGEAHKNFDHITNSLTRYLIWEGENVALVENCPGAYEYNDLYKDYICSDGNNRWLEFEWLDGLVVHGPEEAGAMYLWDRKNPGGSSFQWAIDADENYWIYIDYVSSDQPSLRTYNMRTGEENILMSFYEVEQYGCYDGIRFIGWNPSWTRFALVSGNESASDYPQKTKLFVLQIEDGKLVAKDKYNVGVGADCSANNGPWFMADWINNNTLGYYPQDSDYDQVVLMMEDYWGNEGRNRWSSDFAKYLNL